jgi:hypothetical protein
MSVEGPSAKVVLQKLTPDRWAYIRTVNPQIDDFLRRVCNIVGHQPIFDPVGKPTPPGRLCRFGGAGTECAARFWRQMAAWRRVTCIRHRAGPSCRAVNW